MTGPAQQRWGWSLSVLLHAAILTLGSYLIMRPAQYGIAAAPSSTEVDLVQEAPSAPAVPVPQIKPAVPDIAPPTPQLDDVTIPKPLPLSRAPAAVVAEPKPARHRAARIEHQVSIASQGSASVQPDYLRNPAPLYPESSRQTREQGTVLLAVKVDRDGTAESVSLRQTSGYPQLDRAALDTVRTWKFHPAMVAGIPVDSDVIVPVLFKLQ